MNTRQIQCAIDCDFRMKKVICGVYAADEIPQLLQPSTGFIANTDPKHRPGKHWITFFNDNGVLECFDSYGKSPDQYYTNFKLFMLKYSRLKVNSKRLQSNATRVCGQYCLYYLMCRTRGYSIEHIIDMFNQNLLLNDQFVYNFIDDRFYCCISSINNGFQKCTCEH